MKLFVDDSLEKNASRFFEEAKKRRAKAERATTAIEKLKADLHSIHKKEEHKKSLPKPLKRTHWYEKFRWFYSSEGFLCVGGRDATTNEILVKKHLDANDLVFHTVMSGSPFFVIKVGDKKPGDATILEAASATITFSKAWKRNLATTEVYYVSPDQVSKKAQAGEYLPKGSFMIYGTKNFVQAQTDLALGVLEDGRPMAGPARSVKKNCSLGVRVYTGKIKPAEIGKSLAKRFKVHPDDILRILPGGNFSKRTIDI